MKRCSICMRMYMPDDAGPCVFHPGFFTREEPRSIIASEHVKIGWSCCSKRGEAADPMKPGCKASRYHTEDVKYSQIVNSMPVDVSAYYPPAAPMMEEDVPKMESHSPPCQKKEFENLSSVKMCVVHTVEKDDTLEGIAIRYNANVGDIMKANRLQSREIFCLKEMYIPLDQTQPKGIKDEESERSLAIKQFLTDFPRSSAEEARSYLSNNEWVYSKARGEYIEDIEWEAQQLQPDSQNTKLIANNY
eukprot:TRINITY_DN3777_c0_g1_i2.p1 TRINITY_DN3777_c0_g1~~TRINITY_DN3777_c0_g1_i2.p1  ORF type:complete len:247 (-),score=64.84 TRINITY_DN3777_c0_g1_i2:38-778(-)